MPVRLSVSLSRGESIPLSGDIKAWRFRGRSGLCTHLIRILNTTQNCFVSEAFAPFLFRLMERKACVVFKILVFFFSISNIFKKPHHSHHFATQGSPMILWIELCRKPKKAPLNFGYHDVMRTAPMHRYGCAMSWHGMPTSRRRKGRYLIECQLAQVRQKIAQLLIETLTL